MNTVTALCRHPIAPKINILGKEVQIGKGISFNPFGKKKEG